jgi:hypothetical protein
MRKFYTTALAGFLLALFSFWGLTGTAQTTSYLGLDGGFEGSATIDNTSSLSGPAAGKWAKSNANVTIAIDATTVRSGSNSLKLSSATASTGRVYSPSFTITASTTRWVVQCYRRATSTTATVQFQLGNYRNGTEVLSGSYAGVSAANTWEKVTYAPTSVVSSTTAAADVIAKMSTSAGDVYLDDFVMYESAGGTVDVTAPSSATTVTVTQNASTPSTALDIAWTAAVGGVDGGGYMVVRYATAPNADNDPNTNGVYASGNTHVNGTGGLTGTIVYVGTATSFTNSSLAANTTYYYKVYTYDKAYNYAAEASNNGATASSGLTAPTLTAAGAATVDAPFNVTFPDDASWRAAITGITIGGTPLTAGSSITAGQITFTPSASTPAALLQTSGSKSISIQATGYANATVSQSIGVGAPALHTVSTQPVGPTANGGALATQPVITVRDQYSNLVSGITVTAAVTSGQESSWTLGGTATALTNASGVATFSGLTATNATSAPFTTATLSFTPSSGTGSATSNTFTVPGIAPTLTPAPAATVDNTFDITFTEDATWRANITSITVGGTPLAVGAYDKTNAGLIRFTPSVSTLLQSTGTKAILINATNYNQASASQPIAAGAANKLAMTTQPAAPASNGAVLATQPVVAIRDQYGNATTSTATVTAAIGAGSWTIGGTVAKPAVSGSATFTDLTATSAAAVTGATISFTSSGLTGITSGTFNIPAPAPANDFCVNATALTVNASSTAGTTLNSTLTSLTNDIGGYDRDVWYKVTPACAGNLTITLATSGQDIDLFAYSTSCPTDGATYVTNGAGETTNNVSETITFAATAGTTYYIRAVQFSGTAGAFTIVATGTAPVLTLSNGGTPATGNITPGASSAVLFGFTVTPGSCVTSYDLSSVTVTAAGTATASDLSIFRVVYDADGNGSVNGVEASVSGAGIAYAASLAFTYSGETSLTGARKYLVVADVDAAATNGHTFTGSITPNGNLSATLTPAGSGTGTAAGNTITISSSAPTLTAAPAATVDGAFIVTFTDDPTWRVAITGVTVAGTPLTAGYSVASGQITFTPSASTPAALLQASGTKTISVQATGYTSATVSQVIGGGAAAKLSVTTQPAAPASNGAVLATQPVVAIVDQYGNATTSTATVTASVSAGVWTIGGTTSKPGVSGTATFTDVTATSATAVTASIAFSSAGLTGATSNTFTVPAPNYLTIASIGVAVTENFNGMTNSSTASLPIGFRLGGTSTSTDFSNLTSVTTQAAGTTGAGVLSTTGGAYNFADGLTASSTDRSIGFLSSGGFVSPRSIVVKIRNTTGSTITDLAVSFDYEKYRNGTNAVNWTFFHGSATSPTTAAATGDLVNTVDGGTTVVNPATTTSKSVTLTGLSIANGADYYLRWTYTNSLNTNSQAWGIDNVSVTAGSTIPYVWSGGATGDYTVASNWTPTRTSPAITDILNFTSGTVGVTNVPTEQFGRLNVSGNAQVTLTGSSSILQIDGNSSYSLNVASGSSLIFSGIDVSLNESALVDGTLTTPKVLDLSTSGKTLTVNGTIDFGTTGYLSNASGGGNFTLNSGATLRTGNAAGIRGPGFNPNTGSILVGGTRTFNSGANYVLEGSVASPGFNNITLSFAGIITGTLTINNSGSTAALDRSLTVPTLTLTSGTLSTNGFTLTVASITRTSGTINAASGTLSFSNGTAFSVPAGALATTIGNLTTSGAGVVTMADAHTVSGAVNISAGGLTLGADIAVGGSWTRGATASFTHNNHKVTFNGGSAQTLTVTGGGTIVAFDVDIDNSAGVTLATGTNLTVAGTLTLTSGTFAVGNNNLTLNGDIAGTTANLSVSATADLIFAGSNTTMSIPSSVAQLENLTIGSSNTVTAASSFVVTGAMAVNGTFTPTAPTIVSGSGTLSGTGTIAVTRATGSADLAGQYTLGTTLTGLTVSMSGASAQGLGAGSFGALVINNASNVTLGGAVNVSGALNLSAGHLVLNAFPITLGSITGGGSSAYILTDATGVIVRKTLGGLEEFPVGVSLTSYSPVSVDNATGKDWTVGVVTGIVPASGTFHLDKVILRTWNLTPSSAPGATDLAFTYDVSDAGIMAVNFTAGNSVTANHYNAVGHWEIAGLPQSPVPVGTVYTVVVSGQTAFSPFAVSESNGALPVTLLTFTGKRATGGNELTWRTASESHSRGFELQRSTDGVRFSAVTFIGSQAPGGNSNTALSYRYLDAASISGDAWYRLKQVDFDGRAKTSPIVRIRRDAITTLALTGLYPNPAGATAILTIEAPARGTLSIVVTDATGRPVRVKASAIEAGSGTVLLDLGGLPAGSYTVRAVAADGSVSAALKLVRK